MPESQQMRDIFHKMNQEIYTLNEWHRQLAIQLDRIATALERMTNTVDADRVIAEEWKLPQ